ncbi:MAG: zf-HC2 domain-containing protein [Blastocatellia bacterium]|nr:zf-HC2 domain-containing protein [Blastocatellia bacterium]
MFGRHIGKRLSAYLQNELEPEEYRRVAEHLLHCRQCRSEYENIKLGAALAAGLVPAEAPASLWNDLEVLLEQKEKKGLIAETGPTAEAQREQRKRGGQRRIPAEGWRGQRKRRRILVSVLSSVMVLVIGAVWFYLRRPQTQEIDRNAYNLPSWTVKRLEGSPKIGEKLMTEQGRLAPGQWLVTDGTSRAQISVGDIGEVKVEPNSRIGLVAAHADEHRLAIPKGKMQAFIWAPPRQFYVDTPSAIAVDLGCSYTLEVNDEGQGLLQVIAGWVAFEWEGRETFVPAEAECLTRPGLGPGTPYFSDVSREFRDSLARFDTAQAGDPARGSALEEVLRRSRKKDAFTLWHLLTRANETEAGRVYDRLARLVPPPSKKVTRSGILRGDRAMIDAWWDELQLGDTDWWRMWKGPIPSK